MTGPYYSDEYVTLWHGDALQVLLDMPEASVDAVVTDPPYGLEFMGREWDSADGFRRSLNSADTGRDSVFGRTSRTSPEYRTGKPAAARIRTRMDGRTNPTKGKSITSTPEAYVAGPPYQQWCQAWAEQCLRVLKPGGHLLAFGGTRTVHRLTCAIEDAGFEIRDGIDWIYASGFPKSLDVSKAIDKAAGAEREVVGTKVGLPGYSLAPSNEDHRTYGRGLGNTSDPEAECAVTAPATEDACRWEGWGTALKPAREPIVVARKSTVGTVAANVQRHGTGALNIDACRIGGGHDYRAKCASVVGLDSNRNGDAYGEWTGVRGDSAHPAGRWPSNVVFSHAATTDGVDLCGDGCIAGCPVAEVDQQSGSTVSRVGQPRGAASGDGWGMTATGAEYDDAGGASRFFPVFRYEAKAPASERPRVDGVAHPTVKPLALMRWLVRLVTAPGGLILDPFAGSGTTAEACVVEGFRCVTVEREADYLPLITARLCKPLQPTLAVWGQS